jgi:hypothetical protein
VNQPIFHWLHTNKMNNDTFIVPTGHVQDIPGFRKLFFWTAAYYMEHVEEMEDVANVKKQEEGEECMVGQNDMLYLGANVDYIYFTWTMVLSAMTHEILMPSSIRQRINLRYGIQPRQAPGFLKNTFHVALPKLQ